MKFHCPHCRQAIEAGDELIGHALDCPACGGNVVVPSVSRPVDNRRKRGGGFLKFLLLLLVIAAGAFGYVVYRFNESPEQVWQRILLYARGVTPPGDTPVPEATPAPLPDATASPLTEEEATEAAPNSVPKPEATPDAIAFLIEHREAWPREVTLLTPERFEILQNGFHSGFVEVKPGTKLGVTAIEPGYVTTRFVDASKRLPITATDLSPRAAEAIKTFASRPMPETRPAEAPTFSATPAAVANVAKTAEPKFVHPGIPFTKADLEELKRNITREPWKTGYAALQNDGHSKLTYKMRGPFPDVSRKPDVHLADYKNDMQAVYNLARMWVFTGNPAYAQKGRDIMLAWATGHQRWSGAEPYLTEGDYAYRMYGGADILRGTWPGWTAADTTVCKNYFEKVFWPAARAPDPLRSANQGILQLVTGVGLAAFNDDRVKFEQCLRSFRADAVGGLADSLPNGELGDFGRDQGHGYGQLWTMSWIAEVFWKQGIDVFADLDNRLLAAGEYYARYNLGVPTPWLPFGTKYDYYLTHGGEPEGAKRPADVMNLIHSAYVLRKGLSAPFVARYRDERGEDMESFVFRKSTDNSTAAAPPALPAPAETAAITSGLRNVDIGGAQPAGNASYADGQWTIRGAGTDIWNATDSFHFTYTQVSGDFTFIARLTAFDAANPEAKAGLELRDSLAPDSKRRVHMAYTPRAGKPPLIEIHLRGYSANSHNSAQELTHDGVMLPHWIKFQRIGTRVTIFHSAEGASWTPGQNAEYPGWTDTAYIGIGVCSRENGKLATATFTDVRVTGGDGREMVKKPAAPFAVYASPSEKQVSLRWLESFGAASYNVKRATTKGGPYKTVASAKGASEIDRTVTAGEHYYYVVSAVNAAGESADSPEEDCAGPTKAAAR